MYYVNKKVEYANIVVFVYSFISLFITLYQRYNTNMLLLFLFFPKEYQDIKTLRIFDKLFSYVVASLLYNSSGQWLYVKYTTVLLEHPRGFLSCKHYIARTMSGTY